jgi:hypothetical protein
MDKLLLKLKQEHDLIFRKMDAVVAARSDRGELFRKLQDLLVAHMSTEEECVYLYVSQPNHHHHEIKELLQRLNLLPDGRAWIDTFGIFRNAVIVHCKTEEDELFREVRGLPMEKIDAIMTCVQAPRPDRYAF